MKTALITTETNQQIILQPENLREHRVLQMLTLKNADIQVSASELEITDNGSIQKRETNWRDSGEKPTPLLVQVQDAGPFSKEPGLISLTKEELQDVIVRLPLERNEEFNAVRMADVFMSTLQTLRELRDPNAPLYKGTVQL